MPKPNKGESKEDYVARFMSSEEAKKDYPDSKQRYAVAESMYKKSKSKMKETLAYPKIKEDSSSEEEYIPFVAASTLPDRVRDILPDGTEIKGEILSKTVLEKQEKVINDFNSLGGNSVGHGSYRTISLFHDRVYANDPKREPAGFIRPGSAKVVPHPDIDGHFNLVVEAKPNKMYSPPPEYPDYTAEKIRYMIENDAIGLSMEYNNRPDQEEIVDFEGEKYRYILDSDDFRGFGWARANMIGNPAAVRIKEIDLRNNVSAAKKNAANRIKTKEGENNMTKEIEELKQQKADADAKIKELQKEVEAAKDDTIKVKEIQDRLDAKTKDFEKLQKEMSTKIKEGMENFFSEVKVKQPLEVKDGEKRMAKVKEIYDNIGKNDFVKFKEQAESEIEANDAKIKESINEIGLAKFFNKYQTVKVKCSGSKFIVESTSKTKEMIAKTKDVADTSSMAESTYYQTNAMFADNYVAGITETFLFSDNLLKVMNKEQHMGGNDKYQWKIWTEFDTVTGDSTAAVNPLTTSVTRDFDNFEKMETRICEYRKAVEVADFTEYHTPAGLNLMGEEIMRKTKALSESLAADLFKPKTDATSGWYGVVGLIGVADSSTYGTMYGKTRSAANRLLDSTTANTYESTSESVSVELIRESYEKVLAHGSELSDLAIPIHPTQMRLLWNTESAAIRNNQLTMAGAPPTFGFNRAIIPHLDGIPMIRDYRCESSAAAADMYAVVDLSKDKGFNLVVSKPAGIRNLAKGGMSETNVVNFYGCSVYKSPRNVYVHTGLSTS